MHCRSYISSVRAPLVYWPLHDIGITNMVWCMAYQRKIVGGSYMAQ